MNWYPYFMACLLILWVASTEKDRPALRVILAATLASHFLVAVITRHIPGIWKLSVPATVETLTILALYRFAWGRTALIQVIALLFAWVTHALCFADLKLGTDLVYSKYEIILLVVAIVQVLAFHDTIRSIAIRLAAVVGVRGMGHPRTAGATGVGIDSGKHPGLSDL